jgi:hypothetical protein
MFEVIAPVTPNAPAAAAANDRALADALARRRAAPRWSRLVLPPGTIWLDQPVVLGEAEADLELHGRSACGRPD